MISPPINEREFASLINEHSRIINKVSYFYASEKLPYDDLRQEIYVNIWLGLKQFRGDSKISTWIYRVAVNSALMAIRSLKPRIETIPMDFSILDISSEIDDMQKENLQQLYSLINRLEEIEKAIMMSDVGITPSNDGAVIRLVFPVLTEERRKELAKDIKKRGEDNKVAVRNIRRDGMDAFKKLVKAEVSEDEIKELGDQLQKLTDKYIKEVDKLIEEKTKEIMTV